MPMPTEVVIGRLDGLGAAAEPVEGQLFLVAVDILVAGMVVLCLLSLGMLAIFPTLHT